MSRKIEKTKEVIAKIVKEGISQFLWDWNFDLHTVASRLEYRGLKGEDLWTAELLEMVLVPYREHVKRQSLDEVKTDIGLKVLSEKIGVPIDKTRKQFYMFEFEKPTKEEPARTPETKPAEKEEIELEG